MVSIFDLFEFFEEDRVGFSDADDIAYDIHYLSYYREMYEI